MDSGRLKEKRFQECNWIEKMWRYRWYLTLPFSWCWYQYIKPFYITDDKSFERETVNGKMLWKLLIGIAQSKMKWYYTWEEVKERLDIKKNR